MAPMLEQWAQQVRSFHILSWLLTSFQAMGKLLNLLISAWMLSNEKNSTECGFHKMGNLLALKLGSPKMACFRHGYIQGPKQCHHDYLLTALLSVSPCVTSGGLSSRGNQGGPSKSRPPFCQLSNFNMKNTSFP